MRKAELKKKKKKRNKKERKREREREFPVELDALVMHQQFSRPMRDFLYYTNIYARSLSRARPFFFKICS